MDVKHCVRDTGRRQELWRSRGTSVAPLHTALSEAQKRGVRVDESTEYTLLKVTYDGEVMEADRKFGEELSYSVLYRVQTWDILSSNMGVGRGAIGVVPKHCNGLYVSNEYTILVAKNKADALYYCSILR